MNSRLLRAADYRRVRWRNGGGWTTEIAVAPSPDDPESFDWRVSIAEIDSDGAFSTFPGCDRYIALLDGPGMELTIDSGDPVRLDQRLKFVRFAGEAQTSGRLLGAPVRDFNVIVRRDAFSADVLHRPLVGPMVFLPEAATTWFIHLVGGQATLKGAAGMELSSGESLLLEPGGDPRNHVLNGGGEVVLVKLTRGTG